MDYENEYECKAFVDGKLVEVVATFETDYPEILLYGIFLADGDDTDVTEKIHADEFDRIYTEICAKVVGDMTDAADMFAARRTWKHI